MNNKSNITNRSLKSAIKKSITWLQVRRALGGTGSIRSFKRRAVTLNIDTSHFRGRSWARTIGEPFIVQATMDQILVRNSMYSSPRLLARLLQEGVKAPVCHRCGLSSWQGHTIPLILKCKNGVHMDLRRENLITVCHNCSALPDNPRKWVPYRDNGVHRCGSKGMTKQD